jgi:2-polyprenyl-6-methoxyphenol hydroxylase-like FAD-dependent oxidoreductase
LALALLKVEGVSCTIYELRQDGFEQGQHISLAPNALRVLNNLGVLEKIQAIGNSYEELHFRNAQGGMIATFHNGNENDYGFKAMRIHRRHVQQILVEECLAQCINIRKGMKLISIQEGKDFAELSFENGETAQAHLVVGADGLHSSVREHVLPQSGSVYARMLGVTGFLDKKDLHPSIAEIALPSHFVGQNGFIAVMPSNKSGEEIGVFSTMPFLEDRSRHEWKELFHDKESIRSILTDTFSKGNGWHETVVSITKTLKSDTLCTWP